MKKKIICLLISMIFVLGALAGCSQKGADEALSDLSEKASTTTHTLSMYLVCEKLGDSEEEAKKIEEEIETAVNKITKAKFKTQLDLRFFTEEEYYEALEADFQAKKDYQASGGFFAQQTTAADGEETEEQTYVDESGLVQLVYPEIKDFQVDIFYIGGQAKFLEYSEAGYLSNLNDEVANASKLLSSYITPSLLSTMKSTHGGIMALPTNKAIGEYTYLLLNKDVLSAMKYGTVGGNSDYSGFTSLISEDCQDILNYVDTYMPDYVPLYSGTGELDVKDIQFFGADAEGNFNGDSFSLLGGSYDEAWSYGKLGEYTSIGNILQNSSFKEQMLTLKSYEEKGYYAEEDEADKPFAVGYVKGGAEVVAEYEDDYEVIVVSKPRLETEDLYSDLFAVHSTTSSVARSMEIVTYLNTNVDFRNLLLYGVEGTNYELVTHEEKDVTGRVTATYNTVRRLNDDYIMDVNKTGNVFIAYPLETEPYNLRDYQKNQNRDVKTDLLFGFSLDSNRYDLNMDLTNEMIEMSAQLYEEMMACETVEELTTFFDEKGAEVSSADFCIILASRLYSSEFTDLYDESKYGKGDSYAIIYDEWLIKVGSYKPEAG